VWLAGLALLFGVGILLSWMTLRTIESQASLAADRPGGLTLFMRRVYAAVLHVTSVYYYLSIPVVILLVVGAGGGAIYGLLSLGRVPVKLLAVIVVVAVVTVIGIIRSLFIRVRDQDPGPRLEERDAPEMFAAIREVADKIGTPPVDSVFIVPGSEIAVFERGSPFKHLGKATERCLVLGLAALQGITELQLKAILGHEFGHLSNRDTAGGRVALHVRRSILASAESLAAGGAATWYNPAWLFLQAFYRLYLRVSQGASRLQEVLADRWAAFAYGARAFAEGLRHVIRRSFELDYVTHREVTTALKDSRPLNNLYALPIPSDFLPGDERPEGASTPTEAIEKAFEAAMTTPISSFDSHPPPNLRIAWVEKLEGTPVLKDSREEALRLLPKEKLHDDMTKRVSEQVVAYIEYQQALAQQAAAESGDDSMTTLGPLTR
jgi:Zn-dependent protease with chaperone function